jgi:hypothetical protein
MSIALGHCSIATGAASVAIGRNVSIGYSGGHYDSAYESSFMNCMSPKWNEHGWRDWFSPYWIFHLASVEYIVKYGALWFQTKKDETEIMISLKGKQEFPLFETIETVSTRLKDIENRLIALEYAPPGVGGIYYQSALHDYTQVRNSASFNGPANEAVNDLEKAAVNESVKAAVNESVNDLKKAAVNESVKAAVNESVNDLEKAAVNESVKAAVNESIIVTVNAAVTAIASDPYNSSLWL